MITPEVMLVVVVAWGLFVLGFILYDSYIEEVIK